MSYTLLLMFSKRRCVSHLTAYLLSVMCLHALSLIYLYVYTLLIKLNHTQPGFHRSRVAQNILHIDAHVFKATLYIAFDCVSTISDASICFIAYLCVYILMLTFSKRRCISHLTAYLLSVMRLHALSLIYLYVYTLLIKLNHAQPGFHRSRVAQNILHIDAHVFKATLYIVFDCVSTINDVSTCLITYLFVCLHAFIQTQSCSTRFPPVTRRAKYPTSSFFLVASAFSQ